MSLKKLKFFPLIAVLMVLLFDCAAEVKAKNNDEIYQYYGNFNRFR